VNPSRRVVACKGPMALIVAALALALAGCGRERASTPQTQQASAGEPAMSITVTSTAFTAGQTIPKRHTGDGEDLSPPLSWIGVPAGAKELALIMEDPDAPVGLWVHWVLCKVPPGTAGLAEGVPKSPTLTEPAGAIQGKNSWSSGNVGYRGPAPPPGKPHRYIFRLYALNAPLDVKPGLTRQQLLTATEGHVLAQGELTGLYGRR